ncbi:MAG: OmpA family protein [Terriglobia bacterium]|jgi:outer membrane protein OmpA-like peptidoglycan-associated protein
MRVRQLSYFLSATAALLLFSVQPLMAQRGRLVVRVVPRETYIFADGIPVVDANHHFVVLDAGEHKIDLYNYGYKPASRNVTIAAGKTTILDLTMEPIPATVSGPWGCITLEGADRAAVLLNGKDPAFFVGHGDEFNNEWVWKQELIVPPGKYDLTVLYDEEDAWSTSVDVPADQRVVVDAYKGVRKTVAWKRGAQSLPRFKAGTASAQVAIQKVTGQFSAGPTQINCGDSARLTWSSDGAVKNEISGVGPVGASGDQTVQLKQTTGYKFTAAGPGGVYTSDATVNVNSAIQALLNVSPAEVRYHKIGDKVDQQGSATVTWSAGNASTASVDPFGSVGTSGNRTVTVTPTKTALGPIDETVTYTLHASNACGGAETRTAALHIVGSIDVLQAAVSETTLETKLTFNSIYFPYNLPTKANPEGGLVPSQGKRLDDLATDFKQYLEFRPEAHLILGAHADVRGTSEYNKVLSQRRADRVKSYLIDHGVPVANLETQAFGKEQNLTNKEVLELNEQNPNITPEDRQRVARAIVAFRMANNRRVDVRLSTTGQTSIRFFPYNSEDLKVLLGEPKPAAKQPAKKAPAKK